MILRILTSCRFVDSITPSGDSIQPRADCFVGRSPDKRLFAFDVLERWGIHSNPSVLLCDSIDTNTRNPCNPSFLDLVRSGRSQDVVNSIKNTNLRETDEDSWTCLHWAVEMGHRDLVEIFLDADPLLLNMKTREGLSCINIAAWRGDEKMVQLLLNQGAEIDDKTKWGETPLHHAVTFGHAKVCETLLKAGANAHSEDRLNRTPYQIAMQKGTKQVRNILSRYPPANK